MLTPQIEGNEDFPLSEGWSFASTAPGAARVPGELDALSLTWLPATVPGTVGGSLPAGARDAALAGVAGSRLDAADWWYRCSVPAAAVGQGAAADADDRLWLTFDGLATVADVWLNGQPLLQSENMFVGHTVDVTGLLARGGELVMRFQSLDARLTARRPRPRWRAPMVEHQQLRWFRTTLLGRTPGWSPALPAVGPWRPVRLQRVRALAVDGVSLTTRVDGVDGVDGVVNFALTIKAWGSQPVTSVRLTVTGPDGASLRVDTKRDADGAGADMAVGGVSRWRGELRIPGVALWWPHTHGAQPLYQVTAAATMAGADRAVALGRVGFRRLHLSTENDDFAVSINDTPIFCRGACWTPPDVATLTGTPDTYRRTLQAVRDAGMNMLRVAGPMVYETDLFHDLCDELGILLWQDFMFANMDYPEEPAFVASVEAEARQSLTRWQGRPSLTILCGDSEGEQQAAMWGAPPATWQRGLFRRVLPALCEEICPGVPYWPSSASGGAFPHQPNAGTTSYYGVGAYLRPLDDARRSEVRFASEALAFANVPDDRLLATLGPGGAARAHTPTWKAGVPRDLGAGWDFDDVRDHYLQRLFGVDPAALRSTDPDRYWALSRITSGEVMEAAFAEWRRARSTCRGALIWFLRDLVVGAGWGVLDVHGRPKVAYHYVKRALRDVAVFFSDEGLNGAYVHAVNERAVPWTGELRLRLYRDGEVQVGAGDRPLTIGPRGAIETAAAALLGEFSDTTAAYHFGPPSHDLAVVSLVSPAGDVVAEAFHFPSGRPAAREADLGLTAALEARPDDTFVLTVSTRRFAQAVAVNLDGHDSDDDHFHLAPGATRRLVVRRAGASSGSSSGAPRGNVQAVNCRAATRIVVIP